MSEWVKVSHPEEHSDALADSRTLNFQRDAEIIDIVHDLFVAFAGFYVMLK